jgi:hypothetical protein
MTDTAVADPVILIGRCIGCKRPFRTEIPGDVAGRFGPRLPNCIPYVMQSARISPVWCDCRDLCEVPECGDRFCEGHKGMPVRFTAGSVVKVTHKPEEKCGGSCWSAKSSKCTCSCRGKNHGGAHQIPSGR